MEVMKKEEDEGTRQDFNDLERQLCVVVNFDYTENEKHYRMKKVETFRKVLKAAAEDFNVPLRFAEFKLTHSNIPVTSDNYFEDYRERASNLYSRGLIQFGQNMNTIKLVLHDGRGIMGPF